MAAKLVLASFAWLLSVFTVLSLMASDGVIPPPDGVIFPTDVGRLVDNDTVGADDSFSTNYLQCVTNHPIIGLLVAPITCVLASAVQAKIPIITEIFQVVMLAFGTVSFLFTMTTYSISTLDPAVNLLIFGPPGIAMAIVAIGIIRGVGPV